MAYAGPRDLLEIDLGTKTWRRTALADDVFADALGGVGLAVRLIDERVRGRLDPLGPENPLVFAAGPFASTPVPAANKHALATISPLTGLLNEGLSSSHFSAVLRRCGLAALVVTGIARTWTTIAIDGDEVRFEDAAALRGLSARETTKALRDAPVLAAAVDAALGGDGEPLRAYADGVRRAFDAYAAQRRAYYALEQRWTERLFWKKRGARR